MLHVRRLSTEGSSIKGDNARSFQLKAETINTLLWDDAGSPNSTGGHPTGAAGISAELLGVSRIGRVREDLTVGLVQHSVVFSAVQKVS